MIGASVIEQPERDFFIERINSLDVKCPVHSTSMEGKRVEVKTDYGDIVRKIMYIGKCKENGCNKWFEYTNGMILWP